MKLAVTGSCPDAASVIRPSCLLWVGLTARQSTTGAPGPPVLDGPADRPRRSMRPATPALIEVGRQTRQAARPDAQEVWWDAERQCADRDQGRPCRSGAHQARWVRLAEDLAGPYDVIARVQAPSL